jgi:hypothetical protein
MGEYCRGFEDVVSDNLWSFQGLSPNPDEDIRHRAVAEVLRRLPNEWYKKLQQSDEFCWYIPAALCWGEIRPFPATVSPEDEPGPGGTIKFTPLAAVLFLSPELERYLPDIAIAAAAHELAHLALHHDIPPHGKSTYERQQEEAWVLVRTWGFEREADAHAAKREEEEGNR